MGLFLRFRRIAIAVFLGLFTLGGVVATLAGMRLLPGDHADASVFRHAVACADPANPTPDCLAAERATVQATKLVVGTTSTGSSNHRTNYQTDVTLATTVGGTNRSQVVTVGGNVTIPVGTEVPVTMWRGSIVDFSGLGGGTHQSDTNPAYRDHRDRVLLAVGTPIAFLFGRLLLWSRFRGQVRAGRYAYLDVTGAVLAGLTIATAVADAVAPAVVAGALALAALGAGLVVPRLAAFRAPV